MQQSDGEDDPAREQDDEDEQSLRQADPIVQGCAIGTTNTRMMMNPVKAAAPAAKVLVLRLRHLGVVREPP